MTKNQVIKLLREQASPDKVAGMTRFGINPKKALGLGMPTLRGLAKKIGTNHELAAGLWASGIHEARILASLIDDPALVSNGQMESWAADFDSWDVCDQTCLNLFGKTAAAWEKAAAWSARDEEFVRRAGFALMAVLAVHDKQATDDDFAALFPHIAARSTDERNFVKKAVNWALRQIGKRNPALNKRAIAVARDIARIDSRSARWIAKDALRELGSPTVNIYNKR